MRHTNCGSDVDWNQSKEADMKRVIYLIAALSLLWASIAGAQVWVRPHIRKDGTYVPGHYRSRPDASPYNNWSYPGNTNPYTGEIAPGNPDIYLDRYRDRRGGSSIFSDRYNYDFLSPYPSR